MKIVSISTIVALFLLAAACKPSKNNSVSGGGKGGNVTIRLIPELWGEFVDTCMVYVKYGSLDAPAGDIYDDSVLCITANDTPSATFTNLKVGLYYFYGKGYHTGAGHPPDVKGSKNCTISADGSYLFFLPTFSYTP